MSDNLDKLPIVETREYRGTGWFPTLACLEEAVRRGIIRAHNFNGPNLITSKEQYDQIVALSKERGEGPNEPT